MLVSGGSNEKLGQNEAAIYIRAFKADLLEFYQPADKLCRETHINYLRVAVVFELQVVHGSHLILLVQNINWICLEKRAAKIIHFLCLRCV